MKGTQFHGDHTERCGVEMAYEKLIWLGLVVYSLILLFTLAMTRSEQIKNRVPLHNAVLGFLGCVFWPVTVVVFLVSAKLAGGQKQG